MNKTSKIIKKFLKIFFIFIILIVTFTLILMHGISINNFKLANVEVHDFYLKLDKKLILNTNKVYIKKANNDNNLNIDKLKKTILELDKYRQIFLLFKNININEIDINDNKISIFYDKEIFHFKSNNLEINMNIDFYAKELIAKITQLNYKNLSFTGDLKIAKTMQLNGSLSSKDNEINAKIDIKSKRKDIILSIEELEINDQIKALSYLSDVFTPTLDEWLIKRVKFEHFKGNFAFHIKNNKLENAFGLADFKNVIAKYDDAAPAGNASILKLELKDLSLTLNGQNLTSEDDVKVDDFKLFIDDLTKPNITIDILANDIKYNKGIEKIINAYGVYLGLNQISGKSNAKVNIKLNNNHTNDVMVDVLAEGGFVYDNLTFNAKTNVNIHNSLVKIKGNISSKQIKANEINMSLDASKKLGDIQIGKLFINYDDYFKYEDKANLKLNLNNKTLTFSELNSFIDVTNALKITADIKSILPYSKYLNDLNFKSGKLELTNKNNSSFISLLNTEFDLNLYKNKDFANITEAKEYISNSQNKYNYDDFYINATNNNMVVNSKSNSIIANSDKIELNNIIIKLEDELDNKSNKNTNLILKNSKVIYKEYILDFAFLELINNNIETKINAKFKNGGDLIAKISKNDFQAYVRNLNAINVNKILSKDIFISGKVDLDILGKSSNDFTGLINISEAFLANTKNYINLISALDAIPSLVTFKKDKKDKKGLGIKIGSIEFSKKQDMATINAINIKGYSVDASGSGYIDLKNENANLVMNLFALKNTNDMLSSIPVVKEILIGDKDNKIATQLKVYGALSDLKFQTSVAKDILLSPFTLIKNIVTLPKNIIQ